MRRLRLRRKTYAGTVALSGILAFMVSPGMTMDADWDPSTAILAPLLQNQSTPAPAPAAVESFASSVLDAHASETGSVSAFSGEPVSRTHIQGGGTIEVRVFDPRFDSASGRLYRVTSVPREAIIQPELEDERSVAVDYVAHFDAPGQGEELDFAIIPRAGVSFGPEGPAAGAGAQVRVGQYADEADQGRPSWYAFAGAESRALLYDPGEGFDLTDAMTYERYSVVGDVQAGVAMRMGDVDLSLAYIRRGTKYRAGAVGFNESEDFAAVSVTRTW